MSSVDQSPAPVVEFVTFFAGGQSFSIDITDVREIRRWSPVTPLPHAPTEVLGVMNLRGSVIPIYDLAASFGLPATPENARNVIVVAMHDGQVLGLLVEAVSEILSVPRHQIQETPDVRSDTARQTVTGVITVGEGMTRVIDLGAVVQARQKLGAA